jgi:hypothetical protein
VIDTVETITSFTQSNLIGQIKQAFENLPDACSGNGVYQKYAMPDAALSAFSVSLYLYELFYVVNNS